MKKQHNFLKYKNSISSVLEKISEKDLINSMQLIKNTIKKNGKVYLVGNGGSASIASHVSVDFAKIARIPSATFNNSNLITCFANDYGHDNWVVEALKAYTSNKDLIILISSSGTSFKLITFSGFKKNNPLSKLGDINFHIKSNQYNFIEMSHHILLVYLVDVFAKNKLKL